MSQASPSGPNSEPARPKPFFLPARYRANHNRRVSPLHSEAGSGQKSRAVGWNELLRKARAHGGGAKTAEIEIEVGVDWYELADIETGGALA